MSTENDKPFVCPFQGCAQRFTNNDHLLVHQQKHEFSLKFGAFDRTSLLVDQTPTPTRFLKHCDESGLFQELASNPFDEDFQKVTVTPAKQSAQQQDGVELASGLQPGRQGKAADVVEQTASGISATATVATSTPPISSGARLRSTISTSIPVAPPANLVNPEKPVPMASAPSHISNASMLTKQKLLQSIQVKEHQKLLEQQLALTPTSQEILAQALKNAMAVSQQTTSPLSGSDIAESPGAASGPDEPSAGMDIPVVGMQEVTGTIKRRRGRKPDEEEPELKRQRFLERNRAAASRCRAKKKQWVENLEHKAKEMDVMNQTLQQEVLMLRSEVQQLKSILIAHKDCPLIVHQSLPQRTGEEAVDDDGSSQGPSLSTSGVTLLSQLANMPSMSPLIASPIPSVGSVVPNIGTAFSTSPAAIIITTNGLATSQQAPEVATDVEINTEGMDSQTASSEQGGV